MSRKKSLVGTRIERWIILGEAEPSRYGVWGQTHTNYHVMCTCGTRKIVSRGNLTSGRSKSCGCWRSECMAVRHAERKKAAAANQGHSG